jgi:predicted transglutaminase-like cysteine proteinase
MMRAASLVLLIVLALLGAGPAEARSYPKVFNSGEISSNKPLNKGPLLNWGLMLKRWKNGAPCETSICSSKTWAQLVAQVKAAGNPMAMVKLANSLMNAHPYIEDMPNWNQSEYWATAFEFLKKNGDCEDFSISKYMLLKAAGYPVENMRVFSVRLRNLGLIGHAILVVYEGNKAWVLDNRNPAVMDANLVALEFQPVLSVNEQFWWYHTPN